MIIIRNTENTNKVLIFIYSGMNFYCGIILIETGINSLIFKETDIRSEQKFAMQIYSPLSGRDTKKLANALVTSDIMRTLYTVRERLYYETFPS